MKNLPWYQHLNKAQRLLARKVLSVLKRHGKRHPPNMLVETTVRIVGYRLSNFSEGEAARVKARMVQHERQLHHFERLAQAEQELAAAMDNGKGWQKRNASQALENWRRKTENQDSRYISQLVEMGQAQLDRSNVAGQLLEDEMDLVCKLITKTCAGNVRRALNNSRAGRLIHNPYSPEEMSTMRSDRKLCRQIRRGLRPHNKIITRHEEEVRIPWGIPWGELLVDSSYSHYLIPLARSRVAFFKRLLKLPDHMGTDLSTMRGSDLLLDNEKQRISVIGFSSKLRIKILTAIIEYYDFWLPNATNKRIKTYFTPPLEELTRQCPNCGDIIEPVKQDGAEYLSCPECSFELDRPQVSYQNTKCRQCGHKYFDGVSCSECHYWSGSYVVKDDYMPEWQPPYGFDNDEARSVTADLMALQADNESDPFGDNTSVWNVLRQGRKASGSDEPRKDVGWQRGDDTDTGESKFGKSYWSDGTVKDLPKYKPVKGEPTRMRFTLGAMLDMWAKQFDDPIDYNDTTEQLLYKASLPPRADLSDLFSGWHQHRVLRRLKVGNDPRLKRSRDNARQALNDIRRYMRQLKRENPELLGRLFEEPVAPLVCSWEENYSMLFEPPDGWPFMRVGNRGWLKIRLLNPENDGIYADDDGASDDMLD